MICTSNLNHVGHELRRDGRTALVWKTSTQFPNPQDQSSPFLSCLCKKISMNSPQSHKSARGDLQHRLDTVSRPSRHKLREVITEIRQHQRDPAGAGSPTRVAHDQDLHDSIWFSSCVSQLSSRGVVIPRVCCQPFISPGAVLDIMNTSSSRTDSPMAMLSEFSTVIERTQRASLTWSPGSRAAPSTSLQFRSRAYPTHTLAPAPLTTLENQTPYLLAIFSDSFGCEMVESSLISFAAWADMAAVYSRLLPPAGRGDSESCMVRVEALPRSIDANVQI